MSRGGLEARLRGRVAREGPLRFDAWMRACLYDPEDGYYAAGRGGPGRDRDFYTSVSVGRAFGGLLADWAAAWWRLAGCPGRWTWVEAGADDGSLTRDVLDALREREGAAYEAVCCRLLEPSPALREAQGRALAGHDAKCAWWGGWEEAGTNGAPVLVAANELWDSFPVRMAEYREGGWCEAFVGCEEKDWVWCWAPADAELRGEIARWGVREAGGYRAEFNMELGPWLRGMDRAVDSGGLLALDYGMDAATLYAGHRPQGTLRGYREHRREDDPLREPGRRDLTAHVNFDLVAREAGVLGWKVAGPVRQGTFLTRVAARGQLARWEAALAADPRDAGVRAGIRQFQTLVHDAHLGGRFWALGLSKGGPEAATWPGFVP